MGNHRKIVSVQNEKTCNTLEAAKKRIGQLLLGAENLGLCAYICLETDNVPENSGVFSKYGRQIDSLIEILFGSEAVLNRCSTSAFIFTWGFYSAETFRQRLKQLCDLLNSTYEEKQIEKRTSCAAGMVLWHHHNPDINYEIIRETALAALNRQRKRSLQGYLIMEIDPGGGFSENCGSITPCQLFDELGIGFILFRGDGEMRCEYHNKATERLLKVTDPRCGKTVAEAFGCLRRRDLLTLQTLISEANSSQIPANVTCRTAYGKWLTIKVMPIDAGQKVRSHLLLISIEETYGHTDEIYEKELHVKQHHLISASKAPASFEIDLPTRTMSFSPALLHLYDFKNETVVIAKGSITCSCIKKSSLQAVNEMFRAIFEGQGQGETKTWLRCRLTGSFIPVKISWKNVLNDHSVAVKAIGVISPLLQDNESDGEQDQIIAHLQSQLYLQSSYFSRYEDYLVALRKFRHNQKNFIIAMTGFLNEGRTQAAVEFLSKMKEEQKKNTPLVNTGNAAIDTIISEKLNSAIEKGAKVSQTVGLSPNLNFNMMDLCLAVASCLDNAVEAVTSVAAKGQPAFIDFTLIEQKSAIVMKMINSFIPSDKEFDPIASTTKANHLNHGFGLQNVKAVVDKYNGKFVIEQNDNVFTTAFVLLI